MQRFKRIFQQTPHGHRRGSSKEALTKTTAPYTKKADRSLLLSEKRDSNPRPQPWQGCALPTELFSHNQFVPKMRFELTRRNRHYPLKVACLPIPPSGRKMQISLHLSEKRDSNPRPQPWQGCALPTELFSHLLRSSKQRTAILSELRCKGNPYF